MIVCMHDIMKKYLLGIDIGSSSCKICIIDEAGNFIGSLAQEYRPVSLKPGWFEQDPEEWYQAAIDSLRILKKNSGIHFQDIAAVGTTGQWSSRLWWLRIVTIYFLFRQQSS